MKLEASYLRSSSFDGPTRAEAARVYSVSRHAAPPDASYRAGISCRWSESAGLESVLNDPNLRKTNFVMIHGGWPFTREVVALLSKPNAYADFSEQTFMNYPRAVGGAIREWLEYALEKVMFATDAYPFSEEMYREEAAREWAQGVGTTTGRQALGLAITEMMPDGEITRPRALKIAHMVLRHNARKVYQLK